MEERNVWGDPWGRAIRDDGGSGTGVRSASAGAVGAATRVTDDECVGLATRSAGSATVPARFRAILGAEVGQDELLTL
jgi:hypothetical protein